VHDTVSGTARPPRSRSALIRVGGLVVLIVVASLIGYRLGWFDYGLTLEHVERLRKSHTVAGFTIAFVLIYGIGTAIGIPGLPFTIAAGVLFGTLLGSAISWGGSMISAVAGYWIARTVGRNVVSRWLKRFRRMDVAIAEARDFAGMLRLRLFPVLPIGVVNFVSGLARAPFASYMGATAIGVVPSTIIYTYFADSLIEGVAGGRNTALTSIIVASLLLIGITLAPRLMHNSTRRQAPGARK